MEEHDEQLGSVQQDDDISDNMTLIPEKNEQNQFFENEGRLMEVVSRQLHSRDEENNAKDDLPSPSPCKIARHETPDLSSAVKDECDHIEEKTLKGNQSDFSPCLNLSSTTSVVVSKEVGSNYENKLSVTNNEKNALDLSGYTLMFPNTSRHGSISAAPISNNGQVQNILVLNLPPGVNAVLSDQPSETEENVLMSPSMGHGLQDVTNLPSPTSPLCTSSSTHHVVCDTTTKNLLNGIDPDESKARKCPGVEPSTGRVKFLSQVTPEGYVFNTPEQNLVHSSSKIPLSASFSSVSSSTSLRSDELGRSPNSTSIEVDNWQKFRDHNKENSPTSILNGMQGFGPLANHIPVSSYILDSNQVMSDPPQISHDATVQMAHQVCTLATSQSGSQIPNIPHPNPKYGQLTFCHNGLIPQPSMMKEEEKPCPLNYLQSINPNYNTNVSRKTNSLLCLKANLANSKENDPTRHLHNLNERKRRARITIACDFMRKLVPGLSDKTDKATVFEYAARYIHFLNAQVGKEYDANFLVKYCNY